MRLRFGVVCLALAGLLVACGPPAGDGLAFIDEPVFEQLGPTRGLLSVTLDRPAAVEVRLGDGDSPLVTADQAASHQLPLRGLPPGASQTLTVTARAGDAEQAQTSLQVQTEAGGQSPFVVLFDAAHGQTAGNSDWIIDDDAPLPSPRSPSRATDWVGAYSSWGFDLWRSGRYEVRSLAAGRRLRYGESASDTEDLQNVDLLVMPEPNNRLSSSELRAVAQYLLDGGALFAIANHGGSDRDGDGVDSVDVFTELFQSSGLADFVTGVRLSGNRITYDPAYNRRTDEVDPILYGAHGEVKTMGFFAATTMTLLPGDNPSVRGLVFDRGASVGTMDVLAASVRVGQGRMVVLGDSAPADDGTASPGNDHIYDAWHLDDRDNRAFVLNATAWLVGDLTGLE